MPSKVTITITEHHSGKGGTEVDIGIAVESPVTKAEENAARIHAALAASFAQMLSKNPAKAKLVFNSITTAEFRRQAITEFEEAVRIAGSW